MSAILAAPDSFDVVYRLNDLTGAVGSVSRERAMEQWIRLRERLAAETGRSVNIIPAATGLPDLVFVSNAALLFRAGDGTRTAILARFAKPERQGESAVVTQCLRADGWRIVELPEGANFEGVGDCRWSHGGRVLWIGYGAGRTSLRGIAAVRAALVAAGRSDIRVNPLALVSGRAYHMDLALCPFGPDKRKAMWSPWAFSAAGRAALRFSFGSDGLVAVPRRYAWACNSVAIGDRTLLVPRDGEEGYRSWLRSSTGQRIVEVNVSEFQKAGGGVSCMVLMDQNF
jgi:N-dimethylarginine dimethylaminohydrolase